MSRYGPRWKRVRVAALDRDGWRCQLCGRAGRLEVDHVQPLRNGGALYDLENLQSLCRGCHVAKSNRERGIVPMPESWRRLVVDLVN